MPWSAGAALDLGPPLFSKKTKTSSFQGNSVTGEPSLTEIKKIIVSLLEKSKTRVENSLELDRYVWVQHFLDVGHPILSEFNAYLFISQKSDVMCASRLRDIASDFNGLFEISTPTVFTDIISLALPYVRHCRRPFPSSKNISLEDLGDLIRIICASCVGIFPGTQRRPLWSKRVQLYAFFRQLICSPKTELHEFCVQQFSLVRLAVVEYVVYFLKFLAPVELELQKMMTNRPKDIEAVFDNIAFNTDSFRQNAFQSISPEIDWEKVSGAANENYDRLSRICKSKIVEHSIKKEPAISRDTARLALCLPRVASEAYCKVFLPIEHCPDMSTIQSVMSIQARIKVWSLPKNLIHLQVKAIEDDVLYRGPISMTCLHYHVCMVCSSHGSNSATRMRSQGSSAVVCDTCKKSDAVVSIFMPGRMVSVFGKFVYLCPCCTTVNVWRGDGTDLKCCAHRPPIVSSKKNVCQICQRQSFQSVSVLDDRLGVEQSIWLCRWHTPSTRHMAAVFNVDMLFHVIASMRS